MPQTEMQGAELLTTAVTLGEVGRKVDSLAESTNAKVDALAASMDVLKKSLDDQPRWRDMNALTDRVKALEDTTRWTTRTIGAAAIVGVIGGGIGIVWTALGG